MKELSNTILAVVFVCCNGLTNATIITIEPIATGYAVDYDYDGTFDRFYGTPRDDDVRVGRLSWGEARGHVEFRITGIPSTIREYESGNTNDKVFKTLYLDKIYLRRYWYSGSNTESKTSLYGYVGDGRSYGNEEYKVDNLIEENIGRYGLVDVTDFVVGLKNNNHTYAGFVLQEKQDNVILNYGHFWLEAYYVIPEPTTLSLLALGAVLLKRRKR
jgi:hypothetical protein